MISTLIGVRVAKSQYDGIRLRRGVLWAPAVKVRFAIRNMNNTAWQNARKQAGLRPLPSERHRAGLIYAILTRRYRQPAGLAAPACMLAKTDLSSSRLVVRVPPLA
jgi:hypothetical protein